MSVLIRLRVMVALALMACVALVPNAAQAAPIIVGHGYPATFTTGGATCGLGELLSWQFPGANSYAPGLKSFGQVAGLWRGAYGQSGLQQATACLGAPQQSLVLSTLNAKLKKPSTLFKPALIPLGAHVQEMVSKAPALVQPANYDGHPINGKPPKRGTQTLAGAVADFSVKLGPPRPITLPPVTNPDGSITTGYEIQQDYIDVQLGHVYWCGNIVANYRFRTAVVRKFSRTKVPIVGQKITRIMGQPISGVLDGSFTIQYCWTEKDPFSGALLSPAPNCVNAPSTAVNTPIGQYATIGTVVTASEINIPSGWFVVDDANNPTSRVQTATATAAGLNFKFINNRVITGCVCATTQLPVSATAQLISISVCGLDIPVTLSMITVTLGGTPITVAPADSSVPGTYNFVASYGPVQPVQNIPLVVTINDGRGLIYSFPTQLITVWPLN